MKMKKMKTMESNNYHLQIYWDYESADYKYHLLKQSALELEVLATGDLEWAKRHAAHYKLSVPEANNEEKE
jgi:hypothetical protein